MPRRASDPVAAFADRISRTVVSLATQALRMAYLRAELTKTSPAAAIAMLERICTAADTSAAEREVLIAITGMLQDPQSQSLLISLRSVLPEEASRALRRTLSVGVDQPSASEEDDDADRHVPDYGKGRALTLGERKALARRPSRAMFDKLLRDPDPTVVRNLLANPLTTEDDVVRMVARRPIRPEVILEVVRHPRWNVRRRVRLAVVLNPNTPPEVAVSFVGLLSRTELRTAMQGPDAHPAVRQAAHERYRSLPPLRPLPKHLN